MFILYCTFVFTGYTVETVNFNAQSTSVVTNYKKMNNILENKALIFISVPPISTYSALNIDITWILVFDFLLLTSRI